MTAEDNTCTECGRDNPVWFAPNPLWNKVMGGDAGFLCPICFIEKAEFSGVIPTGWVLTEERFDQVKKALLDVANKIEGGGREQIKFLDGDKTELGRMRLVAAEDAYHDALRQIREAAGAL